MRWQFTITDSTSTSTIVEEPIGFTEMSYTLRRNMMHHGVFKTIDTGSLKFVGDAYTILNTEYETNGANALSTLLIEYRCSDDDTFSTFFNGKFDFNTFSKNCGRYCYIECQVIASTCVDTFLSSMDTNIDFDATTSLNGDSISPLTNYTLTIEGQDILLYDSANSNELNIITDTKQATLAGIFHFAYESIYLPNTVSESLGVFNANGTATTLIYKNDGQSLDQSGITLGDDWTDYMQFTSILEPTDTGLDCLGDYQYHFQGERSIKFTAQFDGSYLTRVRVKKYSTLTDQFTTIDDVLLFGGQAFTANIPIYLNQSWNLSGTIPLETTDVLCYYILHSVFQSTGAPGVPLDFTIERTTVDPSFGLNEADIQQNSSCVATTTKSYILRDIFEWMPKAINNCFDTICYADCFGAYQMTNGLMIRNVTNPVTPKIFLSWTDLFINITKIFNIGWGLSGDGTQIIVDDVIGFYTNTNVIDLGSVNEVKFEHARDLTFGLINVGYTKWEAEEYSGLDEMNTQRQYKRNVDSNNSQLDLMSNFITAGYTIEITRRKNMPLTGTSDWRYDNDIFLINTNYTGEYYEAYRGVDQDAANIISPATRMNYRLTPLRTLLNWFKSIAAPTPDYTNEQLKFNSGTGNYLATGKMIHDCSLEMYAISENETITSTDFNDTDLAFPIWKAIYASFTCPLSITAKETLDANPYGTLTFSCNGVAHTGFLVECTYTPEQGTANFKILMKNE